MTKKLLAILLSLLLLASLPLSVTAADYSDEYYRITDSADLLTDEQEAALEDLSQDLRDTYHMDIAILTLESLDGYTPQEFADDFYDYCGYGCGEDYSGALFLLSMEERDWYISTSGDCIYALTDFGIQYSAAQAVSHFSNGYYFLGFQSWLLTLPEYFDAFEAGDPIDGWADYEDGAYHGEAEDYVYYEDYEPLTPSYLISLIVGVIAGGITLLILRRSMNTKRPQRSAVSYLVPRSFKMNTVQDLFLYSQVSKRAKPKNNGGGGSGGGSSVHTSSSGRSHGGGGGKF